MITRRIYRSKLVVWDFPYLLLWDLKQQLREKPEIFPPMGRTTYRFCEGGNKNGDSSSNAFRKWKKFDWVSDEKNASGSFENRMSLIVKNFIGICILRRFWPNKFPNAGSKVEKTTHWETCDYWNFTDFDIDGGNATGCWEQPGSA